MQEYSQTIGRRTVFIAGMTISPVEHLCFTAPDSPEVPNLEKEIDALVYDLYGLTPDEIAIVESRDRQQTR